MHRGTTPPFSTRTIDPVQTVVDVSAAAIRAYVASVGDQETFASNTPQAPATFVLSLRRGFEPDIDLPANSFAMYGGHDLSFHAPLLAGHAYVIESRILDIYEKNGRSGRLYVVARQADVHTLEGSRVARMVERQIIREHLGAESVPTAHVNPPPVKPTVATGTVPASVATIEVGEEIGPESRHAPDAALIESFGRNSHLFEQLFVDAGFARRLGFRSLIVPGPMQSALLEQFLRRQFPTWRLATLSVNFRISIVAVEAIRLLGVITDLRSTPEGTLLECELVIENRDGERATTGQATLLERTA